MATRGCIARLTKGQEPIASGFSGVYHHWDSYPASLGKGLYEAYHNYYNRDLSKMLENLIDNHPQGWSYLGEAYPMDAPAMKMTQEYAHHMGAQYVYAFDEDVCKMHILIPDRYPGDERCRWKVTAIVDLNDGPPDWSSL